MSISYYALPVHDTDAIGPIVEGSDTTHAIDTAKMKAALPRSVQSGRWQSGNDYIAVDVLRNHVLVTHNPGRGSSQIEILMDVLDALRRAGLHVYDPQQGSWFFKT